MARTISASGEDMARSIEQPLLGRYVQANKKYWIITLLCLLALTAIITSIGLLIVHHHNTGGHHDNTGGYIVESDKAVVATDDERCSEIGVSMLRQGGHAVDAAVAAALCLGVVNPSESGIGGGSFMMVRSSSSAQTQAFDMRETAPLASSKNMYEGNLEAKSYGPLSIAVPGELAGLHQAWSKYGRLPWKTLFQPAIRLAKDGFTVAPFLAWAIKLMAENITSDPGLSSVFKPNGKFLQAGDICFNVELGRTLEAVAQRGPQVFYEGIIGEKLAKDVKDAGGILTTEDLRNYKVDVPDAVTVNAFGYTILGMPPPSTGTVGLALVLHIFESYGYPDAAKWSLGLHRLIEAMKHMFAIRMYLGDPNFVDITKITSDMLSPYYANEIRKNISDDTTFPPDYYNYRYSQSRDHGTSNLCVVDADRNAVALTTSLNYYFGSRFLSQSTGIILNNQMDDFSAPTEIFNDTLPPGPNNFIEPNKRPISCMTPIIILKDGQLAGVTGGSGGLYIIPGVIQVFLNHFILGMKPLAAVQSPRVYPQNIQYDVHYENWTLVDGDHIELSDDKKIFLQERGHQLQPEGWGTTTTLIVQNLEDHGVNQLFHGTLTAVGDARKDAKPAGLCWDLFSKSTCKESHAKNKKVARHYRWVGNV